MKINKVLLVYNKPLYQIELLEAKNPHYRKLLKAKHPATKNWLQVYDQHQETFDGVQRTLHLLGIAFDTVYRRDLKKVGSYDLVLTLGGDGTLLQASHHLDRQVLLGINAAPLDSTGALCAARMDNFLTIMVDLLTGQLKPSLVPRLAVHLGKKRLVPAVLNEVLFANRSPAGTSRYLIKVGKTVEEHKSSGVWVATGAGSTAAIHSSGGKVCKPTRGGMQYLVRELLCLPKQKFKLRGGVLPAGQKISLTPTTRQSAVFIDGNHIEFDVEYGEEIVVRSNGKPLRMVMGYGL